MIGETEAEPGVPTCGDEDLLTRAEASAFLAQFGIRLKPSTPRAAVVDWRGRSALSSRAVQAPRRHDVSFE